MHCTFCQSEKDNACSPCKAIALIKVKGVAMQDGLRLSCLVQVAPLQPSRQGCFLLLSVQFKPVSPCYDFLLMQGGASSSRGGCTGSVTAADCSPAGEGRPGSTAAHQLSPAGCCSSCCSCGWSAERWGAAASSSTAQGTMPFFCLWPHNCMRNQKRCLLCSSFGYSQQVRGMQAGVICAVHPPSGVLL